MEKLRNIYFAIEKWFIEDYLNTHDSVYEHAKARLYFKVNFWITVVSIPIICVILYNGLYIKALQSLIGVFGVFSMLFIVRWKNSIRLPALLTMIFTTLIILTGIVMNRETFHLNELFWMVNLIVFGFFMLGIRWGIFYFILFISIIFYYVLYKAKDDITYIHEMGESGLLMFGVEILISFSCFVYLLAHFIIAYTNSEKKLQDSNDNLLHRNKLIETRNEEISTLLKEIHHRVKNNLQVINSLLRLQSNQIKDASSLRVFNDAQNRIRAISLIHERMYKSSELANLSANDYYQGLIADLFRQYLVDQEVKLLLDIQLNALDQDTIIPLGLLLNELLSNSLEHGGLVSNGEIGIQLIQDKKQLVLKYSDNGLGFDPKEKSGFGLELIETLSEQLAATLTFKSGLNRGVNYHITCPMDK